MNYDNWKSTNILPCGCEGVCDSFAHDTAPDWDGRANGPAWDDLSEREQAEYMRLHADEFDEAPFEHDEQSAHYQDWERNR